MKKYDYFIIQDPNDPIGLTFLFIYKNKCSEWGSTVPETINEYREYKDEDIEYWTHPNQVRSLSLEEVDREIADMEVDRWKIIYYSNEYPTIKNSPELYL